MALAAIKALNGMFKMRVKLIYYFCSVCFSISVFWKMGHFLENIFLENYLIVLCLVTTLKMSLRMFSGVWYAQIFCNISCII